MTISKTTRMAYAEVEQFLGLLDKKTLEKIPENVRNVFSEEKDKEYSKKISAYIPIKKQNLMEETLAIIAYLNLEYICENEQEKERLRDIYKRNEEKYREIFQISFDEQTVFKKMQEDSEQKQDSSVGMIEIKKDTFICRLLKFFKRF